MSHAKLTIILSFSFFFLLSLILHAVAAITPVPFGVNCDCALSRLQTVLPLLLAPIMSVNLLWNLAKKVKGGNGMTPSYLGLLWHSLLISLVFSAVLLWSAFIYPAVEAHNSIPEYNTHFPIELRARADRLMNERIEYGYYDSFTVGRKVDQVCFLTNRTVIVQRGDRDVDAFVMKELGMPDDICVKPSRGQIYLKFEESGQYLRIKDGNSKD